MTTLSPHQQVIVQRVVDGLLLKQIALELGTTEGAVRIDLFRAREKAGVDTTIQLVAVASALGWIDVKIPEP